METETKTKTRARSSLKKGEHARLLILKKDGKEIREEVVGKRTTEILDKAKACAEKHGLNFRNKNHVVYWGVWKK